MSHTHSKDGPLGCPPCARERRKVWDKLSPTERKKSFIKASEASQAIAGPDSLTKEERDHANRFIRQLFGAPPSNGLAKDE